jgi:hypothetical protein
MFGRAPGGSAPRAVTGADVPFSPREPVGAACRTITAAPALNSAIQSAVSALTSSVTSSQNRRSTPRHRSAASLAVPSAGPRTSRTDSPSQRAASSPT